MKVNIKISKLVICKEKDKETTEGKFRKITDFLDRLKEAKSDIGIGYEEVFNFIDTEIDMANSGARSAQSVEATDLYHSITLTLIHIRDRFQFIQEMQKNLSSKAEPAGQ